MDKKISEEVYSRLEKYFPDAKPELKFSSDYELLIAVILSAQCTDKRVNIVTKKLFEKHNTPQTMLLLSQEELENYIRTCGLYKSKAKHILSASKDIVEKFNGLVPSDFSSLLTLAGVGRKTANVVSAVAFGKDAIAVDTHVYRVSNRIGLVSENNVLAVEKGLQNVVSQEKWAKLHHLLIFLGRRICKARNPLCSQCPISDLCEKKDYVRR